MKLPFQDCEGCAKRRAAMVETGKKMAEWLKHRIGPPPLDIAPNNPVKPTNDRPFLDQDKMESSA